MKQEDRKAIRLFYQTLLSSASAPQQTDFYFRVLKGNHTSRKAWLIENQELLNVPPDLAVIIENLDELTKEDIAIIAAAQAAPVAEKVINSVWAWRWWPWNWLK